VEEAFGLTSSLHPHTDDWDCGRREKLSLSDLLPASLPREARALIYYYSGTWTAFHISPFPTFTAEIRIEKAMIGVPGSVFNNARRL